MHRIKDIDPIENANNMVENLKPLKHGEVLDTATGLGYSAIELARNSANVTTVEIDPAAIEIAKLNPWSSDLFNNPRITQIIGDILEEIVKFEDQKFTHIFHDPPTLKLSGELYSGAFYKQLHRVLAFNGRLFHYIGDPDSEHGSIVTKGVINRLQEAGFSKITKLPKSFGVLAIK
jgi:uncharacterized protein